MCDEISECVEKRESRCPRELCVGGDRSLHKAFREVDNSFNLIIQLH